MDVWRDVGNGENNVVQGRVDSAVHSLLACLEEGRQAGRVGGRGCIHTCSNTSTASASEVDLKFDPPGRSG